MNYFILLLSLFVLLGQCNALSENIIVDGKINAWHDGIAKDRARGTGFAEYSVEQYAGGMSSGFNLTGNGQYFFGSEAYTIELDDFSGLIVAESDGNSTTFDGNGNGTIKIKSYLGRSGLLVNGMPSGELNAHGVWEIHANSAANRYTTELNENLENEVI